MDFIVQREAVQGRKDGPIIRPHCSGLGNRQLLGPPSQRRGRGWMLVYLPLGCSFLLSFWQSSPAGQRLVTWPHWSAGKTGKCALQLGSYMWLPYGGKTQNFVTKEEENAWRHSQEAPALQAIVSSFIVTPLTVTHNVGARCQHLLGAPSLVLPTCTVSGKTDGCLWKGLFWKSSLCWFTSSAFETS